MRKTAGASLALLIFVVSVLTGCGNNRGEQLNSGSNDNANKKTTITFWLRGSAAEPLNQSLVADIEAYEQQNANIKVNTEFIPISDVETKWNSAFAGGTAPDLFDVGIVNLPSRAQLKQFTELDAYIEQMADKDDFMENIIRLGKYKEKVYGIGYAPSPYVFAYRKDYFEEAGLDPNTPPKNWEELKQYAIALTQKEGDQVVRAGFDIPKQEDSLLFEIFARQNGNKLVDELNEIPLFDEPSAVEAVQFLVDLIPYSIPFADMNKADNIPFTKGRSAMSYLLPDTIIGMIKTDPSMKDKIGIVSNVPGKQAATFSGLRLFSISETSKQKDEAWKLIEFLMSKERMANRMKEINTPVVRKSLVDEYVELDPVFNKEIVKAIEVGVGRPSVTWSPLYRKYATQGYEQSVFQVKPVEEALKDAVAKLKEEIAQ